MFATDIGNAFHAEPEVPLSETTNLAPEEAALVVLTNAAFGKEATDRQSGAGTILISAALAFEPNVLTITGRPSGDQVFLSCKLPFLIPAAAPNGIDGWFAVWSRYTQAADELFTDLELSAALPGNGSLPDKNGPATANAINSDAVSVLDKLFADLLGAIDS